MLRPSPEQCVLVSGAGLSGALTALLLGRDGHRVEVFEKRKDPRISTPSRSRSISLVLSERSLRSLEQCGLKKALGKISIPLAGRTIYFNNGAQQSFYYRDQPQQGVELFATGKETRAVTRFDLNCMLIEAADALPSVHFHFEHEVAAVEFEAGALSCRQPNGSMVTYEGSAIIGADGASSYLRTQMFSKEQQPKNEKKFETVPEAPYEVYDQQPTFGYRVLSLPRHPKFLQESGGHFVYAWPRPGSLTVSVPQLDGKFSSAIFLPLEGANSFSTLCGKKAVTSFFLEHYPEMTTLDNEITESFLANSTSLLRSFRCWPWWRGRAVLLGDACHVMVPFTGQGANTALEDCMVLSRHLREHGRDVTRAFQTYANKRKELTDRIQKHSAGVAPFVMYLMGSMPPIAEVRPCDLAAPSSDQQQQDPFLAPP